VSAMKVRERGSKDESEGCFAARPTRKTSIPKKSVIKIKRASPAETILWRIIEDAKRYDVPRSNLPVILRLGLRNFR
jgi:hypothetical protein